MSDRPDRDIPPGLQPFRWVPLLALAVVGIAAAGCAPADPVREAKNLLEANALDEALEVLREAIDATPGDPELYYLYGGALLRNGQASLASWPLRRAAENPDWAVRSGLLLTRSLLATNNSAAALRAADAVLAVEPDNLMALRLRVDARIGAQLADAAIEDLDRLIEEFPTELIHREKKLHLLIEAERFDEAETVLEGLRVAMEDHENLSEGARPLLCSREVQLSVKRGDLDAAQRRAADCLERFGHARIVVLQAVEIHDARGEPERATEILEAASEALPDDLGLQNMLAMRIEARDGPEEAARLLRETAERLDTPGAWIILRNHQVRNDDMDGALASTDELLRTIAGVPPSHRAFRYEDIPEQRLFEAAVVVAITGDYARAERMREHLEEESHRRLVTARIHFERDELEEALEAWDHAFRLFPSNPGARQLAGIAALRVGQVERGIEHLRNALRTKDEASDAGLVLAQIHVAMGHPISALDALRYHLLEHPLDRDAIRLQVRLAMLMGNDEVATRAVSRLAALDVGEAVAEQARAIGARTGPEAALAFLEERVEIDLDDPKNVEGLAAWVERMVALDRGEAAVARVAALAEANPEHPHLAALYGAALGAAGELEKARSQLVRTLALDPRNHQALVALARVEMQDGELDTAVEHFTRAAAVEPSDPGPLYAAATALIEAGRGDDAYPRLERLLRERPWEGRAAEMLAAAALERGDHGDATLALAEQASVFYAEVGSAAFETLGGVLLERGENDAAVASLRRAAALGTSGPSGLYRVGIALSRAGDIEGAARALETALTVPGFPEAEQARAALARLKPTQDG